MSNPESASSLLNGVAGFRDLLPVEAEAMRAAQEAVLGEMRRWGYSLIETPTLERIDVLQAGLGDQQIRDLLKVVDSDGSVLALVGERTVPTARLAAGKLRNAPLPLRLCYAASVVGEVHRSLEGRRETRQVGAELIGASGPAADAEVIALSVRCLKAAGLDNDKVEVGHTDFFLGLMEGIDLPEPVKARIRAALAGRDFVTLERILEGTRLRSAEQELLLRFPVLRGGAEILDAAGRLITNRRSEQALTDLAEVHRLLDLYGVGGAVSLDLGAIRDFDYYTGINFESFGPEVGAALAMGGRYDGLLARFGRPAPATGFSISLDRVAEAWLGRGREAGKPRPDALVAWLPAGHADALRLGTIMRGFNLRTVIDTEPRQLEEAEVFAGEIGSRSVIHCGGSPRISFRAGEAPVEELGFDQVVPRLLSVVKR